MNSVVYVRTWGERPDPGHAAATAVGCTCPDDNPLYPGGRLAWRVEFGCPVHDAQYAPIVTDDGLSLDDVCAGHLTAQRELAELREMLNMVDG